MKLPALYLRARATEDRLVPRSASRLLVRLASNACVVDIELPHFLLQARPDAAAKVIREFAAVGRYVNDCQLRDAEVPRGCAPLALARSDRPVCQRHRERPAWQSSSRVKLLSMTGR